MRPLSDTDMLLAWERGRIAARCESGPLSLLLATYPDENYDALARLSIGRRDNLLLALREQLFGAEIVALSNCKACQHVLEIHLHSSDLKSDMRDKSAELFSLDCSGFHLEFRLPNSLDLIAISDSDSVAAGRLRLLERLISSSLHRDQPVGIEEIPEHILQMVESRLAEEDPHADLQINAVCSSCETLNETILDIGYFLCKEVDHWAIRLLREIHELARAYGWAERDILKMSSWRRHCYMEMLGA